MAGLDLELVRQALTVARRHGFSEVELESPEGSFAAVLEAGELPKHPGGVSQAVVHAEDESGIRVVRAPMVGFARNGPNPIGVGNRVASADVIAVISALGIENDVETNVDGEVLEVHFQDGDPVQFGQALVTIQVIS